MWSHFIHAWLSACQAPLSMWFSRKESTGVDCHALLQGISPTQGLNSHLLWLLNRRWILYPWATGEAPFCVCVCVLLSHAQFFAPLCVCVCVCVAQSCPILCPCVCVCVLLSHAQFFAPVCVCVCVCCSVMPNSLQPHGLQPTTFLWLWDFPGKNAGVLCYFLLYLLCLVSSIFLFSLRIFMLILFP